MKRADVITLVVIVAILALAAGVAFFSGSKSDDSKSPATQLTELTTKDSPTTFTDFAGNPFSFADYEGQVRVVNSWATWCPFCMKELPDIAVLAREFAGQDVVVIAVNRAEPTATAQAYIDTVADFTGVLFVQDPGDVFYNLIGGFSMPETVFYDSKGNIVFHKRGFMTIEEMRTHTEAALTATN